jgi:hypothetical protein
MSNSPNKLLVLTVITLRFTPPAQRERYTQKVLNEYP